MLERGADAGNVISLAFTADGSSSWTRIHQFSAFAVLQKFMARIWQVSVSHKRLPSKASAQHDDLAEKFCRIETLMKRKSATMWTRDLPRSSHHRIGDSKSSEHAEKRAPCDARHVDTTAASKTLEPTHSRKKGVRKAAKKPTEKQILSPESEVNAEAISRKSLQVPDPSPWMEWKLGRQNITTNMTSSKAVPKTKEVQKQKQWEFTP